MWRQRPKNGGEGISLPSMRIMWFVLLSIVMISLAMILFFTARANESVVLSIPDRTVSMNDTTGVLNITGNGTAFTVGFLVAGPRLVLGTGNVSSKPSLRALEYDDLPPSQVLSAPADIFVASSNDTTLALETRTQTQHHVWAAPATEDGLPSFRMLEHSDLPPHQTIVVPSDIFDGTSNETTLSFSALPQQPRTFWAGPSMSDDPAVPSFRPLDADDLPFLFSANDPTIFTGILPIENGGTGNNGTVFEPNRIMMTRSDGLALVDGEIVAGPGIEIQTSPGSILISNNATLTVPADIFVSTGSGADHSFEAVPQQPNHVWAAPLYAVGLPTFRPLEQADLPPIQLNNTEYCTGLADALFDTMVGGNQIVMTGSGGVPILVEGSITGTGGITVQVSEGSIVIDSNVSITGTPNQVIVTEDVPSSAFTLSLPQDIHTGASPSFSSLHLSVTADQITLAGGASLNVETSSSTQFTVPDPSTGTASFVLGVNGSPLFITNTPTITSQILSSDTASTASWKQLSTVSALSLENLYAVATTNITGFASMTPVILSDMLVDTSGGTYYCMFSTTAKPDNSAAIYAYGLYLNDTIIPGSRRSFTGASATFVLQTQALVTIPTGGTTTINVKWNKDSGPGTCDVIERNIFCQRQN